MVFKSFKARMTMNRMPSQSTAVEGSYKVTPFDTPTTELTSSNNHTRANGSTTVAKLGTRPASMLALNNPMVAIASRDDFVELVPSSDIDTSRKPGTKPRDGLELDEQDVYNESGMRNPMPLKSHARQLGFTETVTQTTPRPVPKNNRADYKKKKVKAPAPRKRLSASTPSLSKNGSRESITLKDERKSSQTSDIDV